MPTKDPKAHAALSAEIAACETELQKLEEGPETQPSEHVQILRRIYRVLGAIDSRDVLQTGTGANPRVVLRIDTNMADFNGSAVDLYRINGEWYVCSAGPVIFTGSMYEREWVHVIVVAEHLKACMKTGYVKFKKNGDSTYQVNGLVYDIDTQTRNETEVHPCTIEPVSDHYIYRLMDAPRKNFTSDVKVVLIRWDTVDDVFAEYG